MSDTPGEADPLLPQEALFEYSDVLYNIHLDDMISGEHRHLFFGEGDVDFEAIFQAVSEIGFVGPACVELSEASRNAVDTARRAKQFLDRIKSQGA